MDLILSEVCLKSMDLIPQQQIYYNGTIYIIDNVIVLSDLVESSGYSSKTLQTGPCPICASVRGFTVWEWNGGQCGITSVHAADSLITHVSL